MHRIGMITVAIFVRILPHLFPASVLELVYSGDNVKILTFPLTVRLVNVDGLVVDQAVIVVAAVQKQVT